MYPVPPGVGVERPEGTSRIRERHQMPPGRLEVAVGASPSTAGVREEGSSKSLGITEEHARCEKDQE